MCVHSRAPPAIYGAVALCLGGGRRCKERVACVCTDLLCSLIERLNRLFALGRQSYSDPISCNGGRVLMLWYNCGSNTTSVPVQHLTYYYCVLIIVVCTRVFPRHRSVVLRIVMHTFPSLP